MEKRELTTAEREFFDQFCEEAELDEELLDCLVYYPSTKMTAIKHKFVNEMFYTSNFNALYNKQLRAKETMAENALVEEEYLSYVFLHERPWRLQALLEIQDCASDTEWWRLVSRVWTDSENIRECQDEWDAVLRSARPGRESMMDEDDRASLADMPELLTIYQGCTSERDDGWSWTTKRATAIWFANRFAEMEKAKPVLRKAVVPRKWVTAYLTNRGESEIIVDPTHVVVKDVRIDADEMDGAVRPSKTQDEEE